MPKNKRDTRVRVLGKNWHLIYRSLKRRRLCGLCDYDSCTITICTSLRDLEELDTYCHELLHACQGYASEDHVAEVATTLATVLWQLGYRMEVDDGRH